MKIQNQPSHELLQISRRVKKIRKCFVFRSGESLAKNELHLLNGLNLRKVNQSYRFHFSSVLRICTSLDTDSWIQHFTSIRLRIRIQIQRGKLMRIHAELTLLLTDFAVTMFSKFESLDLRKITVFSWGGPQVQYSIFQDIRKRVTVLYTGKAGHRQ